MFKSNKKGFSLIEMLIVIAIVAVLVAIVVPTVTSSTLKANAAANAANLRTIEGQFSTKFLMDPETIESSLYQAAQGYVSLEDGSVLEAPTAKECGAVAEGTDMWVMVDMDNHPKAYYNGYDVEYFAAIAETGIVDENYSPDKRTELIQTIDQAAASLKNLINTLDQYPGIKDLANNIASGLTGSSLDDLLTDINNAANDAAAGTNSETAQKALDAIETITKDQNVCGVVYGHTMDGNKCTNCGYEKKDTCVTPDTFVTLADGSMKTVADLTYNDKLLVWNFYTGSYDVAPVSLIINHGYGDQEITVLKFNDGTTLNFVHVHSAFDADLNEFVDISASNVASFVGHNFVKMTDVGYTTVELVGYEIKHEYNGAMSLLSAAHYNVILNGMLTISPSMEAGSLYEPFEVGSGMKYDTVLVQKDIETYGQYTYEEFSDYLTYEQFEAFGIANAKVSVGKGNTTFEAIIEMFKTFAVPFL